MIEERPVLGSELAALVVGVEAAIGHPIQAIGLRAEVED
jgi:hypothetical protein